MPRLLRTKDYENATFSDNLTEILVEKAQALLQSEQAGQTEMIGYLAQRFITNQIFTNTTRYVSTAVYYGKNLVEYTETAWNGTTTYAARARVLYEGKIYECKATVTGNNPTNETYWIEICDDLNLYYVTLPVAEWLNTIEYAIGDIVWYLDKQYTCVVANTNIIPNTDNVAIWGAGTTYSITAKNPEMAFNSLITYAVNDKVSYNNVMYTCIQISTGNLPTNVTYWTASATLPYWTQGDNRNPLIVTYLIDITMYHFLSALNPRYMTEKVKERYDGDGDLIKAHSAMRWLLDIARGEVNPDLPIIIPTQGKRIEWGTARAKQDNFIGF